MSNQNTPIDNIIDSRIIEKMLPLAEVVNDLQKRTPNKEFDKEIAEMKAYVYKAMSEFKPVSVKVEYKNPAGKMKSKDGCHPDVPILLELLNQRPHDRNLYLWGAAGTGKTHAAKQLAEIMDLPLYMAGTAMSKYDHLGFKLPAGDVVRTSFMDAWQHGGLCILDDNDRSDPKAMAALNAATANGDADFSHCGLGRIERHKDTVLIVTGNGPMLGNDARYVAASKQDAAFRDRFLFWEMELNEAFELTITPNKDWTLRVQKVRKAVKDIGGNVEMTVLATMRASFQGAGLFESKVMNQAQIEESTIFKGAGTDMKALVYAKCGKPSTAKGKIANFE